MTLTPASGSEVLTDQELAKLSSSANVFSRLLLRELRVKAIVKSLVQYSMTLDSSYSAFFRKARRADAAKDPVSCRLEQGAVEPNYPCYVRVEKLL